MERRLADRSRTAGRVVLGNGGVARPPGETPQFIGRLFPNFSLAGLATLLLNRIEESLRICVREKQFTWSSNHQTSSRVSSVNTRAGSSETARAFHDQTRQLVRCADGLHELLDIHQRQWVVRMLQIRTHIVRCSAGEALDIRIIHDGFVKLHYRDSNQ